MRAAPPELATAGKNRESDTRSALRKGCAGKEKSAWLVSPSRVPETSHGPHGRCCEQNDPGNPGPVIRPCRVERISRAQRKIVTPYDLSVLCLLVLTFASAKIPHPRPHSKSLLGDFLGLTLMKDRQGSITASVATKSVWMRHLQFTAKPLCAERDFLLNSGALAWLRLRIDAFSRSICRLVCDLRATMP